MEWDKIWATNKQILDPIVPRYTAIMESTAVKLTITNGPDKPEATMQPLHPKPEVKIGMKPVMRGKNLLIERDDAMTKDKAGNLVLVEGAKVTLMKWGNIKITKRIEKGDNIELQATYDPNDTDFGKGTVKLTWICNDPATTCKIKLIEYDHLITKDKLEEGDKIEDLVNHNSKIENTLIAEGVVRNLPKGTHF